MHEVFVGDRQGVEDRLNNRLILGPFPRNGMAVGALTLIFNTPSVTVTFSGSAGDVLTLSDIADEINTAVQGAGDSTFLATMRTLPNRGVSISGSPTLNPQMLLVMQSGVGFTIDTDGTANDYFRLSDTVDTTKAAPVAAAKILGFNSGATDGHYAVIIDLS